MIRDTDNGGIQGRDRDELVVLELGRLLGSDVHHYEEGGNEHGLDELEFTYFNNSKFFSIQNDPETLIHLFYAL